MGTNSSPFSTEMVAWAQADQAREQIPASLNLAASEIESGSPPGSHIPSGTNNWHGITDAHGAQAATREDTPGGVTYGTVRGFRVFGSPADSYGYYARLLGHGAPYRDAVTKFLASDRGPEAVRELARGIAPAYATAERKDHSYSKALIGVMDRFDLYQYDLLQAARPLPPVAPPAQPVQIPPAPKGPPDMNPTLIPILFQLLTDVPQAIQVLEKFAADPALAPFIGFLENLFHISPPTAGKSTLLELKDNPIVPLVK